MAMAPSSSCVPLMFNMPGPDIIPTVGLTNPDFVYQGFNTALTDLGLGPDDHLRNWHMGSILATIIGEVRP